MEEQEGVEEQREAMEKREAGGNQGPEMKCVRETPPCSRLQR